MNIVFDTLSYNKMLLNLAHTAFKRLITQTLCDLQLLSSVIRIVKCLSSF